MRGLVRFLLGLGFLGILAGLCAFYAGKPALLWIESSLPREIWRPLPGEDEIARIAGLCQVTGAYRRDGTDVVLCPFDVALADISEAAVLALVASEDKRFLAHGGVDGYRIPRALVSNLVEGRRSGASTITQQLARTLFLDPSDDSLGRKLREIVIALRLERVWPKDRILTAYMNTVPLGRGHFGFDQAARFYIGKPAKDLTLADALILVAKIPAPERRDPANAGAREEWAAAVATSAGRMVDEGFVGTAQRDAAVTEATARIRAGKVFAGRKAMKAEAARPFEYRRVRDLAARQAPAGADAGRTARVFLTLDPWFQRQADAAAARSPGRSATHPVVLRRDGAVLAIGGPAYAGTYSAALDGVFSLASLGKIVTAAAAAERPGLLDQSYSTARRTGRYNPRETNPHCRGDMPVDKAIALSCNRPLVRLVEQVPTAAADLARRFGFAIPDNPALIPVGGLYGSPVQVAQMMNAVAAGGRLLPARAYVATVDGSGRIVAQAASPEPLRVISREAADRLTRLLRGPVADRHGTARQAAGKSGAAAVYGKTGTATGNEAAWFAGMTEDFTAAILTETGGRPGRESGGGYPAARFGALVDAYWVPRNALAGAEPAAAPALRTLATRAVTHRLVDLAPLLVLMAMIVYLLRGPRQGERQGQGQRQSQSQGRPRVSQPRPQLPGMGVPPAYALLLPGEPRR
ncbi:MAG: penicillin-binding protein [Rhizobiaceae bacterium]|nr:penicillin-binding protein [Rhizobiaceae bacterium]